MKTLTLTAFGFVLLGLQAPSARASGDHSAPKQEFKAAKHSAVTAFDPEEGFKMSEKALQSLGIKFARLDGKNPLSIPKSALVRIKHVTGVYRRAEGWISFVLVDASSAAGATSLVRSEDLETGDEVAVEGAAFLRLTEADLNADTVDGCAH